MWGPRVLAAVFGWAVIAGCQSQEPVIVPGELVGVWRTFNEKYEDRYFEFRAETLVVGMGGGQSVTHAIRAIAVDLDQDLYRVSYRNSDEDNDDETFSFYFTKRSEGGVIRFEHQPNIAWRRKANRS
jgi:hypothetical protein